VLKVERRKKLFVLIEVYFDMPSHHTIQACPGFLKRK
jgi:hypothetical protein